MKEPWQLFGRMLGARVNGIHTLNMTTLEEIFMVAEDGTRIRITGHMEISEEV